MSGYEISPDGTSLAFLSRDASPPPPIANAAGALPPLTRLWVQSLAEPSTAKSLTPAGQYVDSFSWSPDNREIAYAFAPVTGFLAPYSTRIFAVAADGGAARAVVDRAGMNVSPQFSPDGRHLSFVTTNGRTGIIAPRGLAVAPATGGTPQSIKTYPMNGAWIAETVWARDSQSLFVTMNEGTFAAGAQMFEMPIVRVALDTGQAARVGTGASVQYSMSISRDGRTIAYREVEERTMGTAIATRACRSPRRRSSIAP